MQWKLSCLAEKNLGSQTVGGQHYQIHLKQPIITEIIENHSGFFGALIVAINLFQFDRDKPLNYL